ncbi:MAG TPA: hypothetical protein VJ963_13065 [Bacteroidales bacterium]|nr:hypothetical protein [Bacteroidales bacterium]
MDHIVWLDAEANELDNLVAGNKSMIINGTDEKNKIAREINEGDKMYLVSMQEGEHAEATAVVKCIFSSEELTVEESFETIIRHQDKLQLPDSQFEDVAGKKFLVMVELSDVEAIKPVNISRYAVGRANNWLSVRRVAEHRMS